LAGGDEVTQTDAQAALAAAAQIVANNGYAPSPLIAQQITLHMADRFLSWLQRGRPAQDERLIPHEDFRSPSAAHTERINPNDVTFAAAERERAAANQATALLDMPWRTPEGGYTGPHVRGGPACVTPSGANACLCGEKWPCSQSPGERRRRDEVVPARERRPWR
jgi:hypothetical protein